MTRPSWDDYWSEMAALVATRSTCPRAHVGAVLVKWQRVIGSGYNGSPPGEPHCEDVGCAVIYDHCKRTTHAEANALTNALLPPIGATLYVTKTPCGDCRRALSDAGVTDIRVMVVPPPAGPARVDAPQRPPEPILAKEGTRPVVSDPSAAQAHVRVRGNGGGG